jgi:hypothetical protein
MRDPFLVRIMRCGGLVRLLTLATAVPGAMEGVARAEFVPGRLYAGFVQQEPIYRLPPIILEFDPATGQTRKIAELPYPEYKSIAGLRFRPDGRFLRVGAWLNDELLEVDGSGNYHVAYDWRDGLDAPTRMDYDPWGNMYLNNAARREILKFPVEGGPPRFFASTPQGTGRLAAGLDGELYWGSQEYKELYRFEADGSSSLIYRFDHSADSIESMVLRNNGDLFVLTTRRLVRFDGADPNRMHSFDIPAWGKLAFSPDHKVLYKASHDVLAIDPDTGSWTRLGYFDVPLYYTGATDLAVYVPEPHSAIPIGAFLIGAVLVRRHFSRSGRSRHESAQVEGRVSAGAGRVERAQRWRPGLLRRVVATLAAQARRATGIHGGHTLGSAPHWQGALHRQ